MKRVQGILLGALLVGPAFNSQFFTASAQGLGYSMQTITNPTPALDDQFGSPVAAVGSDRLLIGALHDDTGAANAGAAYLFGTNGALLTTFTNPTPANLDYFGNAVAAVGTDRLLIGALGDNTGANSAGAAYLFNTNGALLIAFINPTPVIASEFGSAVAAVGTEWVLIGAPGDNTGANRAGAAHLFSTNGALLTTFTNPTPAILDNFGYSLAAVGNERVLIGAVSAGAAYLFSTNGVLLTTFTNRTPANAARFGSSVAAVGTEWVLIGAPYEASPLPAAGAAYLFSTNGALLTTFTKPTPATGEYFGSSVAAVGSDRVLIGAYGDSTGGFGVGAAYLFSTNGVLLTSFTNPTPATFDYFGFAITAVGSDQVLIGAYGDGTSTNRAGAAYLFSLEPPTPATPLLSINLNPQLLTINLSWPASAEGWVLEHTNFLPPVTVTSWPKMPPPYQTNGGAFSATLTIPPGSGSQFFRLHKP